MKSNSLISNKMIGTIKSFYPSLTKTEQKIANIVLERMEEVVYYSVTQLADTAQVGETTIIRFCRKLGYKGYHEFKLAIATDLSEKQEIINNEQSTDMVVPIASYIKDAIDETVNKIDQNTLDQSVNALNVAKRIYFFGVGTSGLTALDAKNNFLRIGIHVDSIIDTHMQAMTAATLTSDDIVVGLSVSGSTKDTIDSLSIAKEKGAKIIAVTYYARSPITKLADYTLLSGGKESPLEGGSLAAKIAQLFVIDMLCTGIALINKENAKKMKEITAKSVVKKIY
ncbi:transcriptional regulator [Priestia megaterium]|uniref:MurR/RpiR family transcriptional regulator n=1 Tax=Priestia megaterium TaxID=1404 RepID=UPI000BF34B73|nr:MurR/RpiR family transcriptional regulator [Priestia megaterium]PFI60700.1 transcriptional regulator [Priestia megaterium]PFT51721.1 transcriptional regulator [Priestia megaterium]PFV93141.1 transcriptional regulator [Priestia megaterium]